MFWQFRPALTAILMLSLITGAAYPLAVTLIAQVLFPRQAEGSLIVRNGTAVGSRLIGQSFGDPKYFWSRPSATSPMPYNAGSSVGSNLGPLHADLAKAVQQRIAALRAADPSNHAAPPVDLVTSSGSGLDPHISLAAAAYQAGRVARARGLPEKQVLQLIDKATTGRWMGILGEPVVSVLELNLMLDDQTR